MATANTSWQRVSLDLPVYAIDRLNQMAKEVGTSRENLMAEYLLDSLFDEPNEETLEAMEEAKAGKYAGVVDLSSTEAMIKSILGDDDEDNTL